MESANREIERTALHWLSRQDGDAWTEADQAAFESWRRASTAHNVAFIRLQAVWGRADKLKVLGAGHDPEKLPAPHQFNISPVFSATSGEGRDNGDEHENVSPSSARRAGSRFVGAALAALAATFVLAIGIFFYSTRAPSYTTPVGGIASVPIQDGSTVTLNTDSRISVSLTDHARIVKLERGEAYFEVAPDPGRPFIVDAGRQRITALGTAFAVRMGSDTQVTVTEGKVAVTQLQSSSQSQELMPGERLTLRRAAAPRIDRPQLEQALSWRSGLVVFSDVDLAHAVAELNRYNETQIVIDDPDIAAMRFSGKLKPTYFEGFVRLLEDNFPVEAHRDESERIVLVRRDTPVK